MHERYVRVMAPEEVKRCPQPTPKFGELQENGGRGPSIDLTREPWGQPVRAMGGCQGDPGMGPSEDGVPTPHGAPFK